MWLTGFLRRIIGRDAPEADLGPSSKAPAVAFLSQDLEAVHTRVATAGDHLRQEVAAFLDRSVHKELRRAVRDLDRANAGSTDSNNGRSIVAAVRERLDRLREDDIREASHGLHPAIIGIGLTPALRSLIDRFAPFVDVSLTIDPDLARLDSTAANQIPVSLRLNVYRIVEEALVNVYRHAGIRQAEVVVTKRGPDLELKIEDGGAGFDDAQASLGYGLSSVAARVVVGSGSCQMQSRPRHGTRLTVRLPLNTDQTAEPPLPVDGIQAALRAALQAEERLRREVAEVLHGRIQSKLLVARHRLEESEQLWAVDVAAAVRKVVEVRDLLDTVQGDDVRAAIDLVHPAELRRGLLPALRHLTGRYTGRFAVDLQPNPSLVFLDDPTVARIPLRVRFAVYRMIEEALNNIDRHAAAAQVTIEVGVTGGRQVRVLVRDNGRGFDAGQTALGLGLRSIAARAEQAGGTWSVESTPGRGTDLKISLPLRRPSGAVAGQSIGDGPRLPARER